MKNLTVILLFAQTTWLFAGCSDRAPPAVVAQDIRPAKIMTVSSQKGEVVREYSARIEALQTVDLSFQVGGPLAELPVREGGQIEKGALVAALDPTDFQLAVREAEAQLRLASQDLSRKRKVLAENGIAKSVVDDARANYDLQMVRLSKAKESLQDATIYAPFDAYVARRYFDQFVNISPGQPVVRLLDLTQLQVVFNVPEALAATNNRDAIQRAWVEFAFAPGTAVDMVYYENRGEAAALAQTYEVSFLIESPAGLNILPGMTATASVQLRGKASGHILVPPAALVPLPDGALSVWLFDPLTQLVTNQRVSTAAPIQAGVPVLSGLAVGDQIVVSGANQLMPGMRVRPL